jgi:demethylmenaquinone methyltransferase/2-methoxy-6-polyprenyl-1,4-benzoquinol methylase
MFDEIAPTYDLLNRIVSFGLDIGWRRRAVQSVMEKKGGRFLDLAAGTGDFSLAALRAQPRHIIAVDFALHTLLYARKKFTQRTHNAPVSVLTGDALRLPFKSGSFDCVLVAFGVRNFSNLHRGLEEIHRVLRRDGIACILELSQPTMPVFAPIFKFYFHTIVPRVGAYISKHRGAYRYLPASVGMFPEREEFARMMSTVGFKDVKVQPMTFGVVTLFTGTRTMG